MAGVALRPQPEPRYTTEVVPRQAMPSALAVDLNLPDTAALSAALAQTSEEADSKQVIPADAVQPLAPDDRPALIALQAIDKLSEALRQLREQATAPYISAASYLPKVDKLRLHLTAVRAALANQQTPAQVGPTLRRLAVAVQQLRAEVQQREQQFLARIRGSAQAALEQELRTSALQFWQPLAAPLHDGELTAEQLLTQARAGILLADALARAALLVLDQPALPTALVAVYRELGMPEQALLIGELLRSSIDARKAGVRLADIQQLLRLLLSDTRNRLRFDPQQQHDLIELAHYHYQRQIAWLFWCARELVGGQPAQQIDDLPTLLQAIKEEQQVVILAFCERYDQHMLADLIADAGPQVELAVRILLNTPHPPIQQLMQAVGQRWRAPVAQLSLPRERMALQALLRDSRQTPTALCRSYGSDRATMPTLLGFIANRQAL